MDNEMEQIESVQASLYNELLKDRIPRALRTVRFAARHRTQASKRLFFAWLHVTHDLGALKPTSPVKARGSTLVGELVAGARHEVEYAMGRRFGDNESYYSQAAASPGRGRLVSPSRGQVDRDY